MFEAKVILLVCWLGFFSLVGVYFWLSKQLKSNTVSKYLGAFQYTLWVTSLGALAGLILTQPWKFFFRWGFAWSVWIWVGFALWAQLRLSRRLVKITSVLQTQVDKDKKTWKDANLDQDNPFETLEKDEYDVN